MRAESSGDFTHAAGYVRLAAQWFPHVSTTSPTPLSLPDQCSGQRPDLQLDNWSAVVHHTMASRAERYLRRGPDREGDRVPEFTVNPTRHDPYKNFKFRIKWDGRVVAGIAKVSGLRRTTGSGRAS